MNDFILIGVCLFLAIMHVLERYRNTKIVNELLDRLMSRNYGEYASFKQQEQVLNKDSDRLVVTRDEDDDILPIN